MVFHVSFILISHFSVLILKAKRGKLHKLETHLQKLSEKYHELTLHDSTLHDPAIQEYRDTLTDLIARLEALLDQRQDFLETCTEFQHQRAALDADTEELIRELESIEQEENTPIKERKEKIEVGHLLFKVQITWDMAININLWT